MDGYKKIIKSRYMRIAILRMLNFIPDNIMIRFQYFIKLGKFPKLKNPKRFSEKLQWYKLYYRDPLMRKCTDKADVREYVKECGLEHILPECYGVYSSPEEIDFDSLPDSFVIKATLGGGGNDVVLVRNKKNSDIENIKKIASGWVNRPVKKKNSGREWAYKEAKSMIIVEELLTDAENKFSSIDDYKFMCFNGKIEYVFVYRDRFSSIKRAIYDREWNYLKIESGYERLSDEIAKPENFDEMCEVVEALSKKFPFVRTDMYLVNGKIYFGEMTFYPTSGYITFEPDEFDYIMGEHFLLPEKRCIK